MDRTRPQERMASAAAVALLHALIGYAFLTGLGIDLARSVDQALKVFQLPDALPPPPRPEAVPDKAKSAEPADRVKPAPKDPEGAAAPPNIKSRPTEIVAPKPEVIIPVPPPVLAAPIAGPGAASTSGNAPVRGPGTGAGGQGTGTGSGAFGDGGGGGGGAGVATPAILIGRGIRRSDYPCPEEGDCGAGTVGIRFVILKSGRVARCVVTRSSGIPEMDAATCPILEKRLRYLPARDQRGRKVEQVMDVEQTWNPEIATDRWIEGDIPED